MKFLKTIAIDILMIPVIVEIGYLCTRERNRVVTDDHLSPYAKWVADLAGKANENTTSVQEDTEL